MSKYRHYVVERSNFYASLYRAADTGALVTRLTANGTDVVEATVGKAGVWQHYAFVLQSGTNGSKIYRNGDLVAEGTLNYNDMVSPEPFVIGTIFGEVDQGFHGSIDEVRAYDRALTSCEIRGLMRDDLRQRRSRPTEKDDATAT